MDIGIIGLGKLGLPLALTFKQAGHRVLVHDVDPLVRNAIRDRKPHIDEPFVPELMARYHLELAAPDEMALSAHVTFIIVPTPSRNLDDKFSNDYIINALESLPRVDHPTFPRRTVAIVSTVSPGSFTGPGNLVALAYERGYDLVYTPTLIALGSVIDNLIHPDVQIIGGESDSHATRIATLALQSIMDSGEIVQMDYESAAITKLASNVFVTFKIGFANTLAQLCDNLGGDVDNVTRALGFNQRIGPKALTAGAGYGGPCFPRDAAAFAAIHPATSAALLGTTVQDLNEVHRHYVYAVISNLVESADIKTYAILGRAYKENTAYNIESFGDQLAEMLDQDVTATAVEDADLVVIAQPCRDIKLQTLIKQHGIVYDLWRTHGYLEQDRADVTYVALGRGDNG